jgi:hypothetical protein
VPWKVTPTMDWNTDASAGSGHRMNSVMLATWIEQGRWHVMKTLVERQAADLRVGGGRRDPEWTG